MRYRAYPLLSWAEVRFQHNLALLVHLTAMVGDGLHCRSLQLRSATLHRSAFQRSSTLQGLFLLDFTTTGFAVGQILVWLVPSGNEVADRQDFPTLTAFFDVAHDKCREPFGLVEVVACGDVRCEGVTRCAVVVQRSCEL